jgi:hypothetical protein
MLANVDVILGTSKVGKPTSPMGKLTIFHATHSKSKQSRGTRISLSLLT